MIGRAEEGRVRFTHNVCDEAALLTLQICSLLIEPPGTSIYTVYMSSYVLPLWTISDRIGHLVGVHSASMVLRLIGLMQSKQRLRQALDELKDPHSSIACENFSLFLPLTEIIDLRCIDYQDQDLSCIDSLVNEDYEADKFSN